VVVLRRALGVIRLEAVGAMAAAALATEAALLKKRSGENHQAILEVVVDSFL
jgi:hypothetical protein